MITQLQTIEDALTKVLHDDTALKADAKLIETYHGSVQSLVDKAQEMGNMMPAVFVVFTGTTFEEISNRGFDATHNFAIVNVARDLRGGENLRAGIYELLEHEQSALLPSVTLGLNVKPVDPNKIEQLAVTEEYSIFAFHVKVTDAL